MAKSDLIHVQVEGNVFEGKADELAQLLEEGGKTVDAQGNADLWQWSISSNNKLIINEIFRNNEAWLGHIEGYFQPNGDEIFKLCGFERVQVCGPVSDGMKEMAKEMPFPFELYDHLHDGRFGKLK